MHGYKRHTKKCIPLAGTAATVQRCLRRCGLLDSLDLFLHGSSWPKGGTFYISYLFHGVNAGVALPHFFDNGVLILTLKSRVFVEETWIAC